MDEDHTSMFLTFKRIIVLLCFTQMFFAARNPSETTRSNFNTVGVSIHCFCYRQKSDSYSFQCNMLCLYMYGLLKFANPVNKCSQYSQTARCKEVIVTAKQESIHTDRQCQKRGEHRIVVFWVLLGMSLYGQWEAFLCLQQQLLPHYPER